MYVYIYIYVYMYNTCMYTYIVLSYKTIRTMWMIWKQISDVQVQTAASTSLLLLSEVPDTSADLAADPHPSAVLLKPIYIYIHIQELRIGIHIVYYKLIHISYIEYIYI